MGISDLMRSNRRLCLALCLCLASGAIPSLCVADQPAPHHSGLEVSISINPQPVKLPIVDATDNRFVRLSTAEGLSQIKVDHIAQDDVGFMWFGTRYGLYRYDGYNFKVFVHDPGNPNSLDGVVAKTLFKDFDGALWVACDQFLNKFDRTTETFTRYPIRNATHITQDAAGMLWLSTPGGLYALDPRSGRIRHYAHNPNDPSSLSSNEVWQSGEDKRGTFWVACNRRLEEFDRRAGKVTRHILLPNALGEVKFYEDRSGVFWIFHSSPSALAVLDRETNTLTNYAFPERDATLMRVAAMLEDRNGSLWIATHGLGLLNLDRENRKFIRYSNLAGDPDSLPENDLDRLFEDREGNIWVAPGRQGPAYHATKPPPFKKLPRLPPGSTIEGFVGALYADHQGVLWIGEDSGEGER